MSHRVASVETFIVTVPRDVPYLGPLAPDEVVNERGYFVRSGNGVIYPTVDRSVVVRVTLEDRSVGWGETYGICAPRATCEIINDLLAPVLLGSHPEDVEKIWDRLYGLMRVRGCAGGFYLDAVAALDIALWDLCGKIRGAPVSQLLGGAVHNQIAGYSSGLPAGTLAERVDLARRLWRDGHRAFKFAAVISHEGVVAEAAALRQALGPDAILMVDLHWKFDAEEAQALSEKLAQYDLLFIEAPVKPEDMAGLARVASTSALPVAAGEEWATSYEVANRLNVAPLAFIQPEMAHTGITQFRRIAALASDRDIKVAPHATIGIGIFLAASLHVSATLPHLWKHEWQHSIFGRNLALLDTDMGYADNAYRLPTGSGLGVTPGNHFWAHAALIK